jgi:hypothetical protein
LQEAQLQGAYLENAQLQGADLREAELEGADLKGARLQGADLSRTRLQGASLQEAQLQGAYLENAQLQGADLRDAGLQSAKLEGVKLQGADLTSAGIWRAGFPRDLANRWPAPKGLAELKKSPLSPEAQEQLKQDLNSSITDTTVLAIVISRLGDVLHNERPSLDDQRSWTGYATSAGGLAGFHASLACRDVDGQERNESNTVPTHAYLAIAKRMAARAQEIKAGQVREDYAKPLARALLDETCKGGGKALTAETQAALKNLGSAPE